jgi:hypothetical protein
MEQVRIMSRKSKQQKTKQEGAKSMEPDFVANQQEEPVKEVKAEEVEAVESVEEAEQTDASVSIAENPAHQNVFNGLPPHGTVLATITQKEADAIIDISDSVEAGKNTYATTEQRMAELLRKRRKIWLEICEKYGVPYVWPVSFDYQTRTLFVDNPK